MFTRITLSLFISLILIISSPFFLASKVESLEGLDSVQFGKPISFIEMDASMRLDPPNSAFPLYLIANPWEYPFQVHFYAFIFNIIMVALVIYLVWTGLIRLIKPKRKFNKDSITGIIL